MKRKLSLFLTLCLWAGTISPTVQVRAAENNEPVVQIEETAERPAVGELSAEELAVEEMKEAVEEKTQVEDEILVSENLTPKGENAILEMELADEEMQAQKKTSAEGTKQEVEFAEEVQAQEMETKDVDTDSLLEALETEEFESSYGADNTAIAVTPYAYGAELLVIQKGDWFSGTTNAPGVLIVEEEAGVDLVSYVEEMPKSISDYSSPNELVVGNVMVSGKEIPVRYIELDGAYETHENGYGICQFTLNSLEPGKTYKYLLVDYAYKEVYIDYSYEYEITFYPALMEGTGINAVERTLTTKTTGADDEPLVQIGEFVSGYVEGKSTVQWSGLNGRKILRMGLKSGEEIIGYTEERAYKEKIKTENLPPEFTEELKYYAWTDESKRFEWKFKDEETTISLVPYITVEEYRDGAIEQKTVIGEEITISKKNIEDIVITDVKIGYITSDTILFSKLKLSPVYVWGELQARLCYKAVGTNEYVRCEPVSVGEYGDFWEEISGLTPETEYQYCWEIIKEYGTDALTTVEGGTFTTESVPKELTREEIPDEVLWTYLVENYGDAGVLTTDDMARIRYLSISSEEGKVKDLKGIEYAKYLQTCDFEYHEVTDSGILPLLNCTNLTSISIYENELTMMPDFSKLTNLSQLVLWGNYIPVEEITSDKCPAGIDVSQLGQQYQPREINVVGGTAYKDTTENGTYGISMEVKGAKESASSMGVKIIDITDGGRNVLYENNEVNCEWKNAGAIPQQYPAYTLLADISGVMAVEGTRTWEMVCTINDQTITEELTVTVDSDGIGGFQTVPESILPKVLSDYWIEQAGSNDANGDGKISFIELADITYLGISSDNQLNLSSYGFLSYMTGLVTLSLEGEKNFTQESFEELASLKKLEHIELNNVGIINDISILKNLPKLMWLNLYGASNIAGLSELRANQIICMEVDEGTFSDTEIFGFICNKTEASLNVGTGQSLVSEVIVMQDPSEVRVSASTEGVVLYEKENLFYVYGARPGETDITYTYGDSSYTVHVTVTGEEWDADPELGTIVEESKRMRFTGTEGVENARVSRSMVDGEGNIWNISTRTPEKILESDDYTKYAARILYDRTNRFSVETNTARWDFSFYLDTEGNLWVYNQGNEVNNYNFKARYKVMSGVADWQEGSYSEYGYYKGDEYILILRQDGSLWYCSFDTLSDCFDGDDYYFNVTSLRPRQLEKLEDSGVTGVYPNSYLKDGKLYRVSTGGSKKLIAKNITNVWDNTTVILAQDTDGNYYSLRDSYKGKLEIIGTVKEFLMGSYWDSGYLKEQTNGHWGSTGRDMIAGYLLMEDGTLYRTEFSKWSDSCNFVQLDTDVTDLEKDYYWKDDTAYWFTGELYNDYVGPGRGLYPVWEKDEATGRESQTLYVNGVKYLTKVWDWTVADQCIYAVRMDNTLWQFDDDNTPKQVDMSSLSQDLKDIKVREKDIDILDLKKTNDNVTVKWTPVEGAVSYQLDVSSYDSDNWSITDITETEYVVTPYSNTKSWYKIQAMDESGEVIAQSWKFYSEAKEPGVEGMDFGLLDYNGNVIEEQDGTYFLIYDWEMNGKNLLLNVTIEGKEDAVIQAASSDSSVAEAVVDGQTVKLKVNGSGKTQITVTEPESGYKESIYLQLKDYTPRAFDSNLKINRMLTNEAVTRVGLSDYARLEEIEVDSSKLTDGEKEADYANYFIPTLFWKNGEGACIKITLNDSERASKLPNGTYRLPLKGTVVDYSITDKFGEYVKVENRPLILNVVLSDSKVQVNVNVSTVEKMNLFYLDTAAVYKLTASEGKITNAEFVPKNGTTSYFYSSYNSTTGQFKLLPKLSLWDLKGKALNNALKGTLKVTVGESIWTQNLTIVNNTAKPKVTLTNTSGKVYKFNNGVGTENVYAGTVITFKPIDKITKQPIENVTVTLTGYESTKKGITTKNFSPGWNADGTEKDYTLVPNAQGEYTIHFVGKANATATLKILGKGWSEPFYLKYKVSVTNQKMTGKLSASKVTLNKSYAGDQKTLTLTTNLSYTDFSLGSWEVTKLPKGATSSEGIEVIKNGKDLSFTLKEESKADLKKGTYTINIPVTFHFADGISYTPKALKVKVNVLDESITTKNIKWKASGKLDVIDRENSAVTITPTISKLNGEAAEVQFSTEDREAGLDTKLNLTVEDGKIKVRLKTGAAVSTKEKFVIHPQVTVRTETGNLYTITGESKITVKPVQSKVKVTTVQKSLTMNQGTTSGRSFSYTLKGASGAAVERVETVTKGFAVSLSGKGAMQIRMTDSSLKAKTYTVKVKVYLKDQATNAKPVTMNVKVVVKK